MNPSPHPLRLSLLASALALAGCSMPQSKGSSDSLDYRSAAANIAPLEIPPDLTQLSRDNRLAPQGGVVSASSLQQQPPLPAATATAAAAPAAVPTAAVAAGAVGGVAPKQIGDVRIERQGDTRWLVTSLPPEQVWPQLRDFWKDSGFVLVLDSPDTGVMETDWAENRAKLPQDIIRSTLGRVLDSLYQTGERDRFRTRVERSAAGTEIYVSHRGLEEVLIGSQKDQTMWTARAPDPELEAEMLARLMVKLGAKDEAARTQVAATGAAPMGGAPATSASAGPAAAPRARTLTGQPGAALEVDDNFDRAWRRVGLALDRGGFTVEDRDRAGGTYYVRYVDPKNAVTEEPNFFSKMWTNVFGESKKSDSDLLRYRITVKSQGDKSQVAVSNGQGVPDNSDNARRIVSVLIDDLK